MRNTHLLPVLALGAAFGLCASSASAQSTFRVTVDAAGVQSSGDSGLGARTRAVSDDGRYVVFDSEAPNLVTGDGNGLRDVFVHDRWTGATELVSVNSLGAQADGTSRFASLSADGRYVSFDSAATNLIPGVPLKMTRVYVRDRLAGTTEMVSVSNTGTPASSVSNASYLSADGRWVVFQSGAKLAPNGTPNTGLVYVRDRVNGDTQLVSASSAGVAASLAGRPWISANGRYATFGSTDANLVPGDTNNASDAYLRDLVTATTVRVSLGTGGAQANQPTWEAVVSDDGRHVAFGSTAGLVAGTVPGVSNAYLHDRQTLQTTLLSRDPAGNPAAQPSWPSWISPDGRFVALTSQAALLAGDTNGAYDVYLHDTLTGANRRISVDSLGQGVALGGQDGSFSPDLRHHVFGSTSAGLVPGDTNDRSDVFVRDLGLKTQQVAYCTAKTNSLGCVPAIGLSGVPSVALPDAFFVTATEVRSSKPGLFFWGLAPSAQPFGGGTLCVAPPRIRTLLSSSGGSAGGVDCSGAYSFHFDPGGQGLGAGTTVYGQYLSRDPGASAQIGLTDAARFTVTP